MYVASIGNGTIYKIIDSSLSTEEQTKSHFSIYPNPAQETVFIKKSDTSFPTTVDVFDIDGKLVLHQKTENLSINALNTERLSTGLYFMKIKTNSGLTLTHKLAIE